MTLLFLVKTYVVTLIWNVSRRFRYGVTTYYGFIEKSEKWIRIIIKYSLLSGALRDWKGDGKSCFTRSESFHICISWRMEYESEAQEQNLPFDFFLGRSAVTSSCAVPDYFAHISRYMRKGVKNVCKQPSQVSLHIYTVWLAYFSSHSLDLWICTLWMQIALGLVC